ncbi:MAG: hypothetical protein RBS80_20370 [Thermoguttaceae bacterium]|nr:hypothetical protein [Thermoguttaceae bacterium]
MDRRHFLTAIAGASATGTMLGTAADAAAVSPAAAGEPGASSAVLAGYTAEDHRRRLQNIGVGEQAIRSCLRKHLVTSYMPGQCCYNLGEYPARQIWNPDDWDERELDALYDHGIRLIQVHEEWNDSQRLFGGHKFSAANPAGFRRFVDMVHRRGMKVIVYVSSGYFDRKDPDFREEWARPQTLREIYFHYAACSPASPSWRAYLLRHVARVLDDYGVDGLYNDLGYRKLAGNPHPPTPDEILAFDERPDHDGAVADLLALIYAEVQRRGGVVKVHSSGTRRVMTDLKVYDYLWVGEGVGDGDRFREAVKDHPPYVVPCLDMSRAKVEREDELYLHAIPYLQFPLLLAGRPFTGERAMVPGIEYPPEEKCFWTRHLRAMARHLQEHPEGPYSYGWWDSVPGRPEARPTHQQWLKQYLPMVEEGTWAWLEIGRSDLFTEPLAEGIVASAFANRQFYLALANYSHDAAGVQTADAYVPAADPESAPRNRWNLDGRTLLLLRRVQA